MGNEVADRLAKRGAEQTTHGPCPWVPTARCIIKSQLNDWCDAICEDKWRSRNDCRQSKILMPKLKHKWRRCILNRTKSQLRVMVQLVTGHANLRRHRFLMNLEESPICECGEEEETSIHLLTRCPLQARNRWHYLGRATIKEEDLRNKHISSILRFARATNKWNISL